jgi:hypothetical protein
MQDPVFGCEAAAGTRRGIEAPHALAGKTERNTGQSCVVSFSVQREILPENSDPAAPASYSVVGPYGIVK